MADRDPVTGRFVASGTATAEPSTMRGLYDWSKTLVRAPRDPALDVPLSRRPATMGAPVDVGPLAGVRRRAGDLLTDLGFNPDVVTPETQPLVRTWAALRDLASSRAAETAQAVVPLFHGAYAKLKPAMRRIQSEQIRRELQPSAAPREMQLGSARVTAREPDRPRPLTPPGSSIEDPARPGYSPLGYKLPKVPPGMRRLVEGEVMPDGTFGEYAFKPQDAPVTLDPKQVAWYEQHKALWEGPLPTPIAKSVAGMRTGPVVGLPPDPATVPGVSAEQLLTEPLTPPSSAHDKMAAYVLAKYGAAGNTPPIPPDILERFWRGSPDAAARWKELQDARDLAQMSARTKPGVGGFLDLLTGAEHTLPLRLADLYRLRTGPARLLERPSLPPDPVIDRILSTSEQYLSQEPTMRQVRRGLVQVLSPEDVLFQGIKGGR